MTNHETNARQKLLKNAFSKMDPHRFQEIRDAYYKAVEGLQSLADALETADANPEESTGSLIAEHLYACEAIEVMNKSQLGAIL